MAALALAACLPLLAGCGFQPLYARPDAPSSVTADLAHIKVLTIGNRIGQKLRNHLLEDLDPDGSEEPPLYTLGVGRSEERRGGNECVSKGRTRWVPDHLKKNK